MPYYRGKFTQLVPKFQTNRPKSLAHFGMDSNKHMLAGITL